MIGAASLESVRIIPTQVTDNPAQMGLFFYFGNPLHAFQIRSRADTGKILIGGRLTDAETGLLPSYTTVSMWFPGDENKSTAFKYSIAIGPHGAMTPPVSVLHKPEGWGLFDIWVRVPGEIYNKYMYTSRYNREVLFMPVFARKYAILPSTGTWIQYLDHITDPAEYLDALKILHSPLVTAEAPVDIVERLYRRFDEVLRAYFMQYVYFELELARTLQDVEELLTNYRFLLNRVQQEIAGRVDSPFNSIIDYGDHTVTVQSRIPGTGPYKTMLRGTIYSAAVLLRANMNKLEAKIITMTTPDLPYAPSTAELDPLQNPTLIYDPAASASQGTAVYTNIARAANLAFQALPKTVTSTYLTPEAYARTGDLRESELRDVTGLAPSDGAVKPEKQPNILLWAAGGIAAALAIKQAL